MAISPVQEIAKVSGDSVTSISRAYTSNVASGNLVAGEAWRYSGGSDTALTSADLTKTAGTSAITAVALGRQSNVNSANPAQAGVFSAVVTGAGSLTLTLAGPAGSYMAMTNGEYSPGVDTWSTTAATRLESSNSSTGAGTSPAVSGNASAAGEGLFLGAVAIDSGGNNNVNPVAGNSFTELDEEVDSTSHQCGASARRIATGVTTQLSYAVSTSGLNATASALAVYKVTTAGGASSWGPQLSDQLNRLVQAA